MAEDAGKSFQNSSAWIKLHNEVSQSEHYRLELIRQIQGLIERKVISVFHSFNGATLDDHDAEMLESLLIAEHTGEALTLILNAPGGFGLAAERIANLCREYSGGDFEVIVPHMAKSAATMICFGATKIHMSSTGELGPVDPQVPYTDDSGNTLWISAEEYVRSYENLFSEASKPGDHRLEPYLQQLNRYDSRFVEQLRSAQELAANISVRLLASGMLEGTDHKNIEGMISVFLRQEEKNSHGRMINLEEVESCGLNVERIELKSKLWELVWELYIRSDWLVKNRASKVIESASSSVMAPK